MYNIIPVEVRPTPSSTMITYANAFDSQFCLLLRERRSASLVDIQAAAFEVEANIIAAERLEGDAERRRQGEKSSSSYDPEIDELARMIEFLAFEVSKLKAEQHFDEAGAHCDFSLPNPNPYRETHEHLQILQRNKITNEDKGVKPLLQNIVMEEVQHEEEVHVLEGAPFLTRAAYEKAISKGTAQQFVVAAEQQVDQQQIPSSKNSSLRLVHLLMAMQICKLNNLLLSLAQ